MVDEMSLEQANPQDASVFVSYWLLFFSCITAFWLDDMAHGASHHGFYIFFLKPRYLNFILTMEAET
jgi:hypothetical protein